MKSAFHNPRLHVITGGPGAGKTTLLLELEKRGALCVPEAARQIIRDQVAAHGNAVPWANTTRYTELMLARSIADFELHAGSGQPAFFDRGIPDVLCYARLTGLKEEEIRQACDRCRYNGAVFLAPPWKEIYATDGERKQTFAEAVATHRVMSEAYRDCGYELIELPLSSPAERAVFVVERMNASFAR